MIKVKYGSIFITGPYDVLGNPVNTFGVAGAGLAYAFSERYPLDVIAYQRRARHQKPKMEPGDVFMTNEEGQWIAHIATKRDWRDDSELPWIERGCTLLKKAIKDISVDYRQIKTVGLPALGCGLGKLSFDEVYPVMETAFKDEEVDYIIHQPLGTEVRRSSEPLSSD